jgi:hypothetical protein
MPDQPGEPFPTADHVRDLSAAGRISRSQRGHLDRCDETGLADSRGVDRSGLPNPTCGAREAEANSSISAPARTHPDTVSESRSDRGAGRGDAATASRGAEAIHVPAQVEDAEHTDLRLHEYVQVA